MRILELNLYRTYLHAYASFGWMLSVFTFIMKPDVGSPYPIFKFRGIVCATNASFNSSSFIYQQTNKQMYCLQFVGAAFNCYLFCCDFYLHSVFKFDARRYTFCSALRANDTRKICSLFLELYLGRRLVFRLDAHSHNAVCIRLVACYFK